MSRVPSLRESISQECEAMVRYLLATGKRCPPALVRTVDDLTRMVRGGGECDIAALTAAHAQLSRLVAPGYPATIRLLDEAAQGATGRWTVLGSVRLVRQLMVVAIASVTAFIVLSLFQMVGTTIDISRFSGVGLLLNELFWISAASVGASFAMLYQVESEIAGRTFNPAHAPAYWVKILLGVVAGFVMATLLAPELTEARIARSGTEAAQNVLHQPLLAMLGGFSASLVYTVLNRMVESVEQLFAGSLRTLLAEREQAAALRIAGEAGEERLAVAGKLVQVQQALGAGADSATVQARLREVIESLLPAVAAETGSSSVDDGARRVPALALVGDGDAEPASLAAAGLAGPGAEADASEAPVRG